MFPQSVLPALQMLRSGPSSRANAERFLGRVPWAELVPLVVFDPASDTVCLTAVGAAELRRLEAEVPPKPLPWPKAMLAANVVSEDGPGRHVMRAPMMRLGRAALEAGVALGIVSVTRGSEGQILRAGVTELGARFRARRSHRGAECPEHALACLWLDVVYRECPASLEHVAMVAGTTVDGAFCCLDWLRCAGLVEVPAHDGDLVVRLTARGAAYLVAQPSWVAATATAAPSVAA